MSEINGEKKKRVVTKIVWTKCKFCKCRKKEEDIVFGETCVDCFRKQGQSRDTYFARHSKKKPFL